MLSIRSLRSALAVLVFAVVAAGVAQGQDSNPTEKEPTPEEQAAIDQKSVEMETRRRENLQTRATDPREQEIDRLLAEVEKSPNDFDLRYKLGNAYHEGGHLFSALGEFEKAVDIDPAQSRAWVNRGVVLKELGRTEDAEASFRRAVTANPEDALAHINLGDVLLTQKDYHDAVDAYRTAIRIDPAFPNTYYSLAIAFAESGLYRDAARSWRRCAELAAGDQGDRGTADRALENAKLMDEIIADAERELAEREAKRQELQGSSAQPAASGSEAKKGS